jgi:prepilin-type N-terminal cleavage/methylation domain-containing protein
VNFNNLKLEYIVSLWLRDRGFSNENPKEQGFTLIELLVVIIIIGLLAAIALPSFLSQADKARFAEAKAYIGTMSRLQQAYYLEKRTFTSNIGDLGLGVDTASSSYTYSALAGSVDGNFTPPGQPHTFLNISIWSIVVIEAYSFQRLAAKNFALSSL